MTKTIQLTLLQVLLFTCAYAQRKTTLVYTRDIDNFWVAYDSVRTTNDSLKQLNYIQKLYIDKGTPGLKAFMQTKDYTAQSYVHVIRSYPKFWKSIRANTLQAKKLAPQFEPGIRRLKVLYPELRPAKIYFCIGALNSAGTTRDSMVLIGAELATSNTAPDLSELPPEYQKSFAIYYRSEPVKNIVVLDTHEYVHTQEKGPGETLMAQCIYEGLCDFVTELATGKLPQLPYVTYGPAHEQELKNRFSTEMFQPHFNNWLYNSGSDSRVGDLGYYMGYAICKKYYDQSANKKQAIKEMIELDYTNQATVEAFLNKTHYLSQSVAQLRPVYESKRPVVTRISPSTDNLVDAGTKELHVEFSTVMSRYTSIDYGPLGKDHFPLKGGVIFADDHRSATLKVELKPGMEYDFIINGGGFRSVDGYPLKDYEVKFKTK